MIDLTAIRENSRAAARRAARKHQEPHSIALQDLTPDNFRRTCERLPYLGTLTKAGRWHMANVRDFDLDYPYEWFFVDSSGMGGDLEPALSVGQFRNKLVKIATEYKEMLALAIAEVGEFQVHIALYMEEK